MLNDNIKALITATVSLYSSDKITQSIINEGLNKLKEAKSLLLSQEEQPEEPIEKKYKKWLLNPLYANNLIENNFINAITGNQQAQNTYKCTDFIEIPEGVKTISVVDTLYGGVGYHVFAVYDKNKNFIKGSYKNSTYDWYFDIPKNADYDHIDFDLPEGTKYIRFSSSSAGDICGGYYLSATPDIVEFKHESNNVYNVNTIADLKAVNAKTGDVIITSGYKSVGDLGNGTYDIMSYEEFHYNLPNDVKLINNSNNKPIKTPVDEYGNHTLNNGLVAKLRLDGEIRPEQWGAVAVESFNSCQAFVHMFAHVKTGTIKFKKDGTYCLGLIYDTDTISSFKDNPYKTYMTGNLLGGQFYSKPIMANIHNVEFIGDNTTITIPKNVFGNTGMGIFNFGGKIDGLKFSGFNFDGKGRYCSYPNKNSNHTLFYTPATFTSNHPSFKELHPLYDEKSNTFKDGYFLNVEVTECFFKDAGANYKKAGDFGGDFILIVNPSALDNLNIHHNHFESWGRWVLAIDLGGNGECLTNIKFEDNECLGSIAKDSDGNYIVEPTYGDNFWRWRALGLIDFEAKKCFDGVSFQRNYVHGTAGWAINGCSRVSKNFVIKDNYYNNQEGGYPYTVECYSGMTKDWVIENNDFPARCSFKMGYFTDGMTFRNNRGLNGIRTFGLCGDIIIENNRSIEEKPSGTTILWSHESNNYETDPQYTIDKVRERGVNIVFKNNDYSLSAKFTDTDNIEKTSFFNYDFEFDKPIQKANIIDFNNGIILDPTDIEMVGQSIIFKGCRISKPFTDRNMCGNLFYVEEGQTVAIPNNTWGVVGGDFYKNKLIEDFSKYNNYNWGTYMSWNNINSISIICTESGLLPGGSEYGFRDQCTHISYILDKNLTLQDNAYVSTDDDIYWTKNGGKLTQIPNHKEGMQTYTDEEGNTIDLYYIGKVLKAKIVCE